MNNNIKQPKTFTLIDYRGYAVDNPPSFLATLRGIIHRYTRSVYTKEGWGRNV